MHGHSVETIHPFDDELDAPSSWAARMDVRGWITLGLAGVFAAGVMSFVALALSHSM